jgi:hypothetical protein
MTLDERAFLRRDNGDLAREIRNSGRESKKEASNAFSTILLKQTIKDADAGSLRAPCWRCVCNRVDIHVVPAASSIYQDNCTSPAPSINVTALSPPK